ncbi:hypothetical protein MNEG_8509 [Monoraphidium neglectum]|uniref:Uncharacterized protein n=1 Tax=Monoraphidium neglectum TaxID=145388 RepID=A0A0D2M7W3_9CHLO|nr:hypothetical protein MNEG_8509 [Monoraphidium neglectum]KIY99449.1 hypothetical protein MNEG_8509 [Monoraphidium neglectum]|eukprot:XP_013898469.1 hypothetical protein MNEG_8509 [Monoraphidium neglectum]
MFFVMTLWNATWHGPSKYKYEMMLTISAALMALVMGVVSVYIFPEFAIDNVYGLHHQGLHSLACLCANALGRRPPKAIVKVEAFDLDVSVINFKATLRGSKRALRARGAGGGGCWPALRGRWGRTSTGAGAGAAGQPPSDAPAPGRRAAATVASPTPADDAAEVFRPDGRARRAGSLGMDLGPTPSKAAHVLPRANTLDAASPFASELYSALPATRKHPAPAHASHAPPLAPPAPGGAASCAPPGGGAPGGAASKGAVGARPSAAERLRAQAEWFKVVRAVEMAKGACGEAECEYYLGSIAGWRVILPTGSFFPCTRRQLDCAALGQLGERTCSMVVEVNKLTTLLARAAEAAPQLVGVLAGSDDWAEVEEALLGTLQDIWAYFPSRYVPPAVPIPTTNLCRFLRAVQQLPATFHLLREASTMGVPASAGGGRRWGQSNGAAVQSVQSVRFDLGSGPISPASTYKTAKQQFSNDALGTIPSLHGNDHGSNPLSPPPPAGGGGGAGTGGPAHAQGGHLVMHTSRDSCEVALTWRPDDSWAEAAASMRWLLLTAQLKVFGRELSRLHDSARHAAGAIRGGRAAAARGSTSKGEGAAEP